MMMRSSRQRSYVDPGLGVTKTAPQPSTERGPGFAGLEEWLWSVLLQQTSPERLADLCARVRERELSPRCLALASEDVLTSCGFTEDEKRELRETGKTAEGRRGAPKTLVPWSTLEPTSSSSEEKRPVRLAELVIVCSTTRVIQFWFQWVFSTGEFVEKRFPETHFCGSVSVRRLPLALGEFIVELKSTYDVVPGRSFSTTSTRAYRCVSVAVRTNKRLRPFRARAAGAVDDARTYGRPPPTQVVVVEKKKHHALVGLSFDHTTEANFLALGGVWAPTTTTTKTTTSHDQDTNFTRNREDHPRLRYHDDVPDILPTACRRNAYTGARVDPSRLDPWLRDDPDDDDDRRPRRRPVVARHFHEDAILLPTPRAADDRRDDFGADSEAPRSPLAVADATLAHVVAQPIDHRATPNAIAWPVAPTSLPPRRVQDPATRLLA
mmetsp:Transcript_22238/g.71657  ORF Transcript_22238/g.71657 Transcript_22238/m.71657 type:complete len:437 (+) Transcript_22238:144-1454(+)